MRVLMVRAGGFVCAFPVGAVGETLRPSDAVAPVRDAPPHELGELTVRGETLRVLDLDRLLGGDGGRGGRLVTLRGGPGAPVEVALAVDDVLGVRVVEPSAFELAFSVSDAVVGPIVSPVPALEHGRVVSEEAARAWI